MEEEIKVEKTVKIDPTCKYICIVPNLSDEEIARIKKRLEEWWKDPEQRVLVAAGDIKFVKIGKSE